MGRFSGKVVLITGAARGMGAQEARDFHDEGASVVITDFRADRGSSLASELGPTALFIEHDVSSETDWKRVVETVLARFGRIDVLVNNAGILKRGPLLEMSLSVFNEVLAVNLAGTFLGLREVGRVMKAQRQGSIVNMSSISGMSGQIGMSAYASSKWGVRALTRVAAAELVGDGVRVNAICPGPIDTALVREPRGYSEDTPLSDLPPQTSTMMRRYGTPSEVSRAVLFFASDESSFTTGVELPVDGGWLLVN